MGKKNGKPSGSSFEDACDALGIKEGQLRSYVRRGMPKNRDGTFDIPACLEWQAKNVREAGGNHKKRQAPKNSDDEVLEPAVDGGSPELERLRRARADIAEMDLADRREDSMPRREVHDLMVVIAAGAKSLCSQLEKECGPRAAELASDWQSDIEQEIEARFRDEDCE